MMENSDALAHLRARLQDLQSRQKRRGGGNLPHWSNADMEAVETLLHAPPSKELVALARIEGITNIYPSYDDFKRLTLVNVIARIPLGLKPR